MGHVQSPSPFFGARDSGRSPPAVRTVAVAVDLASWAAAWEAKPGAMPPSTAKSDTLAKACAMAFDIRLKFTVVFSMFFGLRDACRASGSPFRDTRGTLATGGW